MAKSSAPKPCVLCGVTKECPYTGRCRACYKKAFYRDNKDKCLARVKDYNLRNPEKHERWKKASYYRLTYGMTLEQLRAMFEAQGGRCPMCLDALRPWSDLVGPGGNHVDHCHATGKVRGLLCAMCNRLLGCARDNPATLTRAISYLEGVL